VEKQAESLNLPLYTVELPRDLPPSHVYENAILETLVRLKGELGVDYVVYGDLFLRDMMEYKRRLLEKVNMKPLYPLEGIDTITLSEIILSLGFKAVVVAVDPRRAPGDLLCRDYDRRFLEELPATVDPAGEYGEFHTFLYQAPLYRSPVNFKVGGVSMVRSKIDSIIVEKLVCNIY
jgi:diphthamide synthase (EF-2-diphthine--ammonia ligase)